MGVEGDCWNDFRGGKLLGLWVVIRHGGPGAFGFEALDGRVLLVEDAFGAEQDGADDKGEDEGQRRNRQQADVATRKNGVER